LSLQRVLIGVMLRRFLLAIGVAALPLAVAAAPSPVPSAPPSGTVHDGGQFVGRITSVDYQQNTLAVDAGARGRVDVAVMPSTSIQGKGAGYRAFTDLKAGQLVKIFSSVADGKYVAQIIQIR
jgi:hypothetical protein